MCYRSLPKTSSERRDRSARRRAARHQHRPLDAELP